MSSTGAPQVVAGKRMDLGHVLTEGGRAFIDDILPLIVATLLAIILTVISLGVLAGPLYAGLCSMVIGRRRGRKPEIGDVFSQLHRFWAFLGAALALVILIALASITIVGGILLAAIWIYVFPYMVYREMSLSEAMSASRETVMRSGFWEHVVLVLLFGAVSALCRGPLVLLSTPFSVATIVAGYADLADEPVRSDAAVATAG